MRNMLIQELATYQSQYSRERAFIPRFISLLTNFHNCYSRTLATGHITASAFITDSNRTHALFTLHRKLNRWLQPGGHADGNENVIEVARKEAQEETGLKSLLLVSEDIFDIDIHEIPANRHNPAHFHYDLRYLFTADPSERLIVSSESHKLAWIAITEVNRFATDNKSIQRMCFKVNIG